MEVQKHQLARNIDVAGIRYAMSEFQRKHQIPGQEFLELYDSFMRITEDLIFKPQK